MIPKMSIDDVERSVSESSADSETEDVLIVSKPPCSKLFSKQLDTGLDHVWTNTP